MANSVFFEVSSGKAYLKNDTNTYARAHTQAYTKGEREMKKEEKREDKESSIIISLFINLGKILSMSSTSSLLSLPHPFNKQQARKRYEGTVLSTKTTEIPALKRRQTAGHTRQCGTCCGRGKREGFFG